MTLPGLRDLLKQLPPAEWPSQQGHLLDLGCGLGEDLFDLFHFFGCAKATGVDQLPASYAGNLQNEEAEQNFLIQFGHPIPFHKYQFTAGVRTLYELYLRYVQNELGLQPLSLSEWEKVFCFCWQTDIRAFVANCSDTYSLVYCSGVLHWLKKAEQGSFLAEVQKCVSPQGLLALMVNSPLHDSDEQEGPFCYMKMETLEQSFSGWEILIRMEMPGRSYLILRKPISSGS
jgi:SAM-dependent methyltransferase